jgi:hypothetical protein
MARNISFSLVDRDDSTSSSELGAIAVTAISLFETLQLVPTIAV